MDGIEFKELFKVAVETLREKTITPLLEADATYQEDSDNEGIAEMHYLQLDLTEEQRKVCNRLLECRDKQDIEYATHAYIAGLYDAFQIMAVLFPDKWDTDDIRELLAVHTPLKKCSLTADDGASPPLKWCTNSAEMVHGGRRRGARGRHAGNHSGMPLRLRMDSPSIWMV